MLQRTLKIAQQLCWLLGEILTLGYAPKYLKRVKSWQTIDYEYEHPKTASLKRPDTRQSQKTKQQREWDRLSVVLSVIAAASASALAIPTPFSVLNLFWVSAACFSASFGLALEGVILITYLTVFAHVGGTGRLGKLSHDRHSRLKNLEPIAFIIALPIVLTTYSAFFLLSGLISMSIIQGTNESVQSHIPAYKVTVLIPVSIALAAILGAIALCEASVSNRSQNQSGERTFGIQDPYAPEEEEMLVRGGD
ncbi:transmembrane protein [Ceratobasidium sp. AG-Ba]|nr:transmembrane protein [Ceratobasidium sp. AG-Ba]